MLEAKKLKALVTTGPERVRALPDTPTMAELGYQDLTFIGWFGVLAPSGTSLDIIDRLNTEAKEIAQQESYRKRMEAIYVDPVSNTPGEFAKLIETESNRLGELIRRANITAEQ